jgi:hypothetical protein
MRPDLQTINTNGIRLRVALAGQGPLNRVELASLPSIAQPVLMSVA